MFNTHQIWLEYNARLLAFISKRVNPDCAQDILQEVFIKIHTQLDALQESTKLESWLYQITRHAVVDYYRAHKPSESLPDWLEQEEADDHELIRQELSNCLKPMIKTLPAHYRAALELSEIQRKTQQEVANSQGLSLSGAKSRVQRGRQLLKSLLHDCCQIEVNQKDQLTDYDKKEKNCKFC